MVRFTLRCTLAALTLAALVALLVPAPSVARPVAPEKGASALELSLEGVLGMLSRWLAHVGTKEGSDIDPDGVRVTPPSPGDEGSDIDPNGASAPAGSDEGPDLDPNGVR